LGKNMIAADFYHLPVIRTFRERAAGLKKKEGSGFKKGETSEGKRPSSSSEEKSALR